MLKNLLPHRIITALKLSFGLWISGVIIFTTIIFFEFNFISWIKSVLFIEPFVIIPISILYLRRINTNNIFKEGTLFGLLLILTHLPADLLFVIFFFKQGIIIFETYWSILFYGEMLLSSMIGGLLVLKFYKSSRFH